MLNVIIIIIIIIIIHVTVLVGNCKIVHREHFLILYTCSHE